MTAPEPPVYPSGTPAEHLPPYGANVVEACRTCGTALSEHSRGITYRHLCRACELSLPRRFA